MHEHCKMQLLLVSYPYYCGLETNHLYLTILESNKIMAAEFKLDLRSRFLLNTDLILCPSVSPLISITLVLTHSVPGLSTILVFGAVRSTSICVCVHINTSISVGVFMGFSVNCIFCNSAEISCAEMHVEPRFSQSQGFFYVTWVLKFWMLWDSCLVDILFSVVLLVFPVFFSGALWSS